MAVCSTRNAIFFCFQTSRFLFTGRQESLAWTSPGEAKSADSDALSFRGAFLSTWTQFTNKEKQYRNKCGEVTGMS